MSRNAVVPRQLGINTRKICDYLLDKAHPHGGSKARFFLGFGFSPGDPMEFADAIFAQAEGAPHVSRQPSKYGSDMLTCAGPMWTPSGRKPWVRSVWLVIEEADGETGRFVTAFPDRDRST